MSKTGKLPENNPKNNQILAALPDSDYERLVPELEFLPMPLGWTMSESGDHVNYLHFPTTGIVSLIYDLEDGSSSEIALVGNEGMVGISIFMGGESMPSATVVQSAGSAFRLSRKIMKREFALGGQLQHLSLLYTQALIAQTSQTAVCNQHHTLEQRGCRWVLMSIDRIHKNNLVITHQLIASLLGVRRESVSRPSSKRELANVMQRLKANTTGCFRILKIQSDLGSKRLPLRVEIGLSFRVTALLTCPKNLFDFVATIWRSKRQGISNVVPAMQIESVRATLTKNSLSR